MDHAAIRRDRRVGWAILAPLAVLAVAYGLWFLSDRLMVIGPLDRAAFGWAVAVPIGALAPMAAAVAWRELGEAATRLAVVALGLLLTVATTVLLALALAPSGLGARPAQAPVILVAGVIGTMGGVGWVSVARLSTGLLRGGHPWVALVVGALSSVVLLLLVALLVTSWAFGICGCAPRPL